MKSEIRLMEERDRAVVLDMMRIFYASDAVSTNGSEEIFENDITGCVSDNPYIEGYVFECEGRIQGYAMLAKSFSTEFGKPCIWVEDLFLKEEYRGQGIATGFFRFIEEKYPAALFRLEVEPENEKALRVYTRAGFDTLPYMEMKK